MSRNRGPGGAGARAAGAMLALLAAGGAAGQSTHLLAGSWDADAVVRFDASTGAYLGVFAPGVMNPHGMTYGPDGHLYVSSFSGRVHRFEGRSGSPMGVFADLTSGPPQPFLAGDLIFHNGLLYVLNAYDADVAMVDPATGEYLGLLVENAGGLGNATNHMALGPDGHLYLTEWRLDVVLKFDGTTGSYLGTVAAGIERASGVAFDEQGIGYVGEYYTISAVRDAVWSFTTSGAGTHRVVREFMQHGPQSLTIGPDGRIHVGDKVSVRVYDRLTGERTALLSAPSGAGNFFALLFMPEGTSSYADCTSDGALNLADFGCFQTKFATGDPYADCNGDSVLNVADFGCFQTRFAQACP